MLRILAWAMVATSGLALAAVAGSGYHNLWAGLIGVGIYLAALLRLPYAVTARRDAARDRWEKYGPISEG